VRPAGRPPAPRARGRGREQSPHPCGVSGRVSPPPSLPRSVATAAARLFKRARGAWARPSPPLGVPLESEPTLSAQGEGSWGRPCLRPRPGQPRGQWGRRGSFFLSFPSLGTPLSSPRSPPSIGYATEKKSSIIAIGLTIHNTPVEIREKLAVPEAEVPRAIQELTLFPHVAEAGILSTCNRLEIYVVARSFHRVSCLSVEVPRRRCVSWARGRRRRRGRAGDARVRKERALARSLPPDPYLVGRQDPALFRPPPPPRCRAARPRPALLASFGARTGLSGKPSAQSGSGYATRKGRRAGASPPIHSPRATWGAAPPTLFPHPRLSLPPHS